MKELVLRDDRELRRIETAIESLEHASPQGRLGSHCLLAALRAERSELLKIGCRSVGRARPGGNHEIRYAS